MKNKTFKITFKQKGDATYSVWYASGPTKEKAKITCKRELEEQLENIEFISIEEVERGEIK